MVLHMIMRCVFGPRLKSMECVIWLMSATAVLFLVYSLGKLQAQYMIESSVRVNPQHEGRHVLSLVKLYEKMGQTVTGTGVIGSEESVRNDLQQGDKLIGDNRQNRIRKMLEGVKQYVPEETPAETPDGANHELDELDGYNYFMVTDEEEKQLAKHALRVHNQHVNLNYPELKKASGWQDQPPNVELHNEQKEKFRENVHANEALPMDNEDGAGNDNYGIKFLYIDEHGNKVYGTNDKKKRRSAGFQPLVIQINRAEGQGENLPPKVNENLPKAEEHANMYQGTDVRGKNVSIREINRDKARQQAMLILGKKPVRAASENKVLKLYVTTNGRLGNHLFQYAALYGLARSTNRIPVMPPGTEIPEMFVKSKFSIQEGQTPPDITMVHETNSGIFSPVFYNLPPEDILLCCYLQSWRYFYSYQTMIRHLFRFRPAIRDKAAILLDDARRQYIAKNRDILGTYIPKLTYIGVHVRRGDYMLKEHLRRGYKPAPYSYLRKAMSHYRSRHANTMFVVSSDDLSWSTVHLNMSDVTFVSSNDQIVDLAALASCNHTIMTVGTYGWWAAWLAGGDVTYYKDWIIPGSEIASSYNNVDYFPPEWLGIGDS